MTYWGEEGNCVKFVEEFPGQVDIFVSSELEEIALAKSICEDCPISKLCLDKALEYHDTYGVWGGIKFTGGRVGIRERDRALEIHDKNISGRLNRRL